MKLERYQDENIGVACYYGDIDQLSDYAGKIDFNFDTESYYGSSPMTIACTRGYLDVVKYLEKHGALLDRKNRGGVSPLIAACLPTGFTDNTDVVDYLLKKGQHPDQTNKDITCLMYTCMYNRTSLAKLLLAYGANINARDNYGRTPFIYACGTSQNIELCKLLLAAGADINAKNNGGQNALMELIEKFNSENGIATAEFLIENGIDFRSADNSGTPPFHWAAFHGRKEILELLLNKGIHIGALDKKNEPAIVEAMRKENTEIIKFLIEKGADVNSKSQGGRTVLEYCIEKNEFELAESLLKKGASLKSDCKFNSDALMEAAKKGGNKILQILLESGTDINEIENNTGETAMMKAAASGNLETIEFLLDHKAKLNRADLKGNTELMHAAYNGNEKIISRLLVSGANVSARNNLNWNCLMHACAAGKLNAAKIILEACGNKIHEEINLSEREKNATPVILAAESGNFELVKLLVENGAAISHRDTNKKNAASYALEKNFTEIYFYLKPMEKITPAKASRPNEDLPLIKKFENWWNVLSPPWRMGFIHSTLLMGIADELRRSYPEKFSDRYSPELHALIPSYLKAMSEKRSSEILNEFYSSPFDLYLTGSYSDNSSEWDQYAQILELFKVGTLEPIREFTNIEILDIRYSYIKSLEPVYQMRSLKKLRICKTQVSSLDLNTFSKENKTCAIYSHPEAEMHYGYWYTEQRKPFRDYISGTSTGFDFELATKDLYVFPQIQKKSEFDFSSKKFTDALNERRKISDELENHLQHNALSSSYDCSECGQLFPFRQYEWQNNVHGNSNTPPPETVDQMTHAAIISDQNKKFSATILVCKECRRYYLDERDKTKYGTEVYQRSRIRAITRQCAVEYTLWQPEKLILLRLEFPKEKE